MNLETSKKTTTDMIVDHQQGWIFRCPMDASGLPGRSSCSRRLMHEEEEEEQGGGRRRTDLLLDLALLQLLQPVISWEPVSHTRL